MEIMVYSLLWVMQDFVSSTVDSRALLNDYRLNVGLHRTSM